MEAISYHLPNFEGPLDVLLQLIQKNKLNIYDIPIVELLRQYMDVIRMMQQYDMEIASEFLEMASRLVYIKSTMLLPSQEETEKLKQELTEELISYQLCQACADQMKGLYVGMDLFVREPTEVDPDLTYQRTHEPGVLLSALFSAFGHKKIKTPPLTSIRRIMQRKVVPVSSQIGYVLRRLYKQPIIRYSSFFEQCESKSEMVARFLALLELIKLQRIKINRETNETDPDMTLINRDDSVDAEDVIKELEEDGFDSM